MPQKKAEEDLKKLNTKIAKTREQLAGTEPLYQEQHKREETAAQQSVVLFGFFPVFCIFFGEISRHPYHVFDMIYPRIKNEQCILNILWVWLHNLLMPIHSLRVGPPVLTLDNSLINDGERSWPTG